MDTITFNLKNFKLIDGDFISEDSFADKIYEESGSFCDDTQWMSFKCGELTIDVSYEISVSGSIFEDSGDYWTPPSCDIDINDVDIIISSVSINEDDVELTDDLKKIFLKVVNNNL
jgi:hypothetical protein